MERHLFFTDRITAMAKIAHNVNKAYCEALGDTSQVDWDAAPDWQKKSAVDGVKFHLYRPMDMTPEESHKNWLAMKEKDGWKYGLVKDAEKKEHPCFLPYGELPVEQRAKDYIFRQVVCELSDIV